MKRIDTGDPNVLEYREPIGWTVLLTLPLFVAVVGYSGLLWSDLLRDVLRNADGVVLLVTGAFVLVALWQVFELVNGWFVCVGVIVDRAAGTVTKQWGLFVALPVQRNLNPSDRREVRQSRFSRSRETCGLPLVRAGQPGGREG
jgi:hypothetical protein